MYDHLIAHATPRQIEFIEAIKLHGNISAAARALDLDHTTVRKSLQSLEVKAARKNPKSHDYAKGAVPDGFNIKGVSQYIDKEGNVAGQWVKTSADAERQMELLKLAVEAMCADVKPLKLIAPPSQVEKDLLNVIPIGDLHYGMHSWSKETGNDYNLKIAEELTMSSMEHLMQSCPKAKTCIILPLGDIFHADNQKNVTPGHGHQLDVDGRYKKIMDVTIEVFRHCVMRALETHENVVVRFVQGNHDPHAHYGLACAVKGYFHDNPRVFVDLSKSPFWFYKHGQVLLGSTHGDTVKPEQLTGVMACDVPRWWGETKFRYFYTGHIHSSNAKEFQGLRWESFRTVAPNDAHGHSHGYRSLRDMVAITHHVNKGEVRRLTHNVEGIGS
jgi:hypothetical protein